MNKEIECINAKVKGENKVYSYLSMLPDHLRNIFTTNFNKRLFFILIIFSFSYLYAQGQSESDDFSYAIKLYEEQFYDLAAQQFIRYVNNYPGSAKLDEAGYYAGMSLFKLNEFENARIEFQSVAVNYPKSKRASESWYMCGECYLKLNNHEEAAKAYEAVKTLYPKQTKAALGALKAGQQYMKIGSVEKADQLFSLIQDRYVGSNAYYPSLISHGVLYFEKGNLGKAKEKFNKILESKAKANLKSNALFMLGKLAEDQGYTKDAAKYFNQIIKNYKNSSEYNSSSIKLAKIHIKDGNYQAAQKLLNSGLDHSPNAIQKEEMTELLGDAHFLNKKYALAQKAYQNYDAEKNEVIRNRRNLKIALSWYHQNNIRKSIEILQNNIDDLPDLLDVYLSLSLDLYFNWLNENQQYEKAIEQLYQLKSTPHFNNGFRYRLVTFLQNINRWQEIIRELEPEIQSNNKFQEKDDFIYFLGYAYSQINNFKESSRFYKKLKLEYPCSKYIKQTNENLQYINTYFIKNESIGISRLALLIGDILKSENKGKLQFELGKIYFENLKDYENAIIQLKSALVLPENSNIISDIYYYIGKSYIMEADRRDISENSKNSFLAKAKENFSKAMENIQTATNPDVIASDFVDCVIRTDNPSKEKKITFYTSLIEKYQQSPLLENWYELVGSIRLYDFKNPEAAKKEYDYLIKNYKSSEHYPIYLFVVAKLLRERNQLSLELFREIAGDYPNSEFAAEALFNLAEIYYARGQYKEANQLYQKLLSDYFYTDNAIYALESIGNIYLASAELEKAIQIYSEQIKNLPLDDFVLRKQNVSGEKINSIFKLGKAFYLKEDWQNARENLSIYLKLNEDKYFENEAYLLLGDAYYAVNDKQSAIDSYSHVNKNDTSLYRQSFTKMANCQFEMKNYSDAAATYSSLLKIVNTPEIMAKHIIALIRNGNRSQASGFLNKFKKRYKKEKNHLASFDFELGKNLRQNKNYNDAIKYFKKVKKNYKNSDYADNADYHEALTYITLNKQKEALDILTNFSSKYPNSDQLGAVLNTLGGIYFRSEKYESAVISFKSSLKKDLSSDLRRQVLSNLIKTYKYVNFWDAALALSRDYIEEYPDAEDVIDKKITISQAYVNLNQFDRAVELLRQARIEADSEKEPEIQFYIGEAYLRAGQYESAVAEFVKIPLLSRKTKLQWEASALYYSGQAYEKMGRINEAIRMYQEIVKRPGIDLILKKDAKKRIEQIKG